MLNNPLRWKDLMLLALITGVTFLFGCQSSTLVPELTVSPLSGPSATIEASAITTDLETVSPKITIALPITPTITDTPEDLGKRQLILNKTLNIFGPYFALSPDGKVIAANNRETINIFEITNEKLIGELRKPEAGLMGGGPVAFSPDGKTLAAEVHVEGENGTESEFYLLESSDLRIIKKHPYNGRLGDLRYSSDGKFVAGTGEYGKIYVWDIKNKKVNNLDSDAYHLAFSPVDPILASGELVGQGGPAVVLWDTKDVISKGVFLLAIDPNSAYSGSATSVSFSPDGHTLAAVVNGQLRFWDMQLNREIDSSFSTSDSLTQATFSKNGHLATIDQNGELVIYDPESGSVIGVASFEGNGDPFYFEICFNMVFSPDGNQLLTGGCGKNLQIWDIP